MKNSCIQGICLRLVASLFFLASFAGTSFAQVIRPELEEAIRSASRGQELRVIVKFSEKADLKALKKEKDKKIRSLKMINELKAKAEKAQGPAKKFLEGKGARRIETLWIANALATEAAEETLRELALDPSVESIQLDYTLLAPSTVAGAATPEWNINAIQAPELWSKGFAGSGTTVAIMDTGVDADHVDLGPRWRAGSNSWYDPNAEHSTPYDAAGHGTMVMGVIAGGNASGTVIGVAPDSKWIAVKIFNDSGVAYLSNIHLGFQWLLDPDGNPATNDSPDVVGNSWGLGNIGGCDSEFLYDIQALKTAGISVVFAAGNYGPDPSTGVSPANYPESRPTGALDESLLIADFSSRGPSACAGGVFPEVAAPGVNIKTADLTYGGTFPNSYAFVSGTSFASAHLAGSIALLHGAFPDLTEADLDTAISRSSLDLGPTGADNSYGHGALRVLEAYNLILSLRSMDQDGDGFLYYEDCNDTDAAVYPGAPEIRYDNIDQDCNGYDLTINVTKALYNSKRSVLTVEASSSLNGNADLALANYGPMTWVASRSVWTITIKRAGAYPGTVTVSGTEGSVTAAVAKQ